MHNLATVWHPLCARGLILAALTALAGPALAAPSQRTFVASYGSDASANCALLAPCRSFNAAIAQTSAGGEVVILDTAGYGPMTINKSIKIIGPSGVYGGISVTGGANPTTGVVINAGASDIITLRGLDISGVPGVAGPFPLHGIDIQSALVVHIEKTSVSNFTQDASECIRLSSAQQNALFVVDSFLRECATGVHINGTSPGASFPVATIDNTHIEAGNNTQTGTTIIGVNATGNYQVNIRKSLITAGLVGVAAAQTTVTDVPSISIIDSQITFMGTAGIRTGPGPGPAQSGPLRVNVQRSAINNSLAAVKNGYGTVRMTDNVISNNTHGLVNCGSDQYWGPSYGTDSTGASAVNYGSNFLIDLGNPGAGAIGCAGYNSPGKFVAQ